LLGLLVHSDYSNFVLFFERIEFLVFVLKEQPLRCPVRRGFRRAGGVELDD
jgi:hypothetical protein